MECPRRLVALQGTQNVYKMYVTCGCGARMGSGKAGKMSHNNVVKGGVGGGGGGGPHLEPH